MFNPTIFRKIKDKTPTYFKIADNNIIKESKILEKLNNLIIPPAWTNVLIDIKKDAKLLVVGYDTGGKKQYIYSKTHIKLAANKKFKNLINFGAKINAVNKKVDQLIKLKKININKMIGIIIKIMLICNFRIGTEYCFDKYGSIGITTIMKKNLKFTNKDIIINFIGKKGVKNLCTIKINNSTKELIEELKKIYDLKSSNSDFIFEIKNYKINYTDIHEFLKFKYGITSKDIRTWNANIILLNELKEIESIKLKKNIKLQKKKKLKLAIENTSKRLHHTVAVCRKNYLYNDILLLYLNKPTIFKKNFINDKDMKTNFVNFLKKKYIK